MWVSLLASPFRDKARKILAETGSPIILAIDKSYPFSRAASHELFMELLKLINSLHGLISGLKIGLPTLLTIGMEGVYRLLNEYDWGLFTIMDLKMADVGHINRVVAEHIYELGFDALIAHGFIGYNGGIDALIKYSRESGVGVILVGAMSHPGSEEALNKWFKYIVDLAIKHDVDGLVLPATMPEYIKQAREYGYGNLILSPGVGPQGAKPGSAIEYGADFEIIGRLIYMSNNPGVEARRLLEIYGGIHGPG